MHTLTPEQRTELEAAAFRRLLDHLDQHKEVQNIDLMILADFCRNCLSKWLVAAGQERGLEIADEDAREYVYKMPYPQWKTLHQQLATQAQLDALAQRNQRDNESAS
ncbi:DUF1244 domain-containing protein [Carnimonas nigrificans]|uniref:DUF1244 domain-containing protein n=1 Tax=Carnimonas nigrificans TaxID=64323 RepID=UPI000471A0C4|nr:DUF1244 domain-containing protein [Carnimonas nigrificans]